MSLMQLLTVGRSFLTVRDRPTPYKIIPQRVLPKFGLTGEASSGGSMVQFEVERGIRAVAGEKGQWVLGNPFKPGRRENARKVVQGELALEAIKVVRNDLMETDFEVVPAAPPERAVELEVETRGTGPGVVGRLVRRFLRPG